MGRENVEATTPKRLMEDLVTWRLAGLVSDISGTESLIDGEVVIEGGEESMRCVNEPTSFVS
ncbi:hypothetical protein AOZ07_17705 [Glutamicibacter halophytocola]|nr:hypothetical protein AOZ07_17705 [Glutamicibacter halophytocola]